MPLIIMVNEQVASFDMIVCVASYPRISGLVDRLIINEMMTMYVNIENCL